MPETGRLAAVESPYEHLHPNRAADDRASVEFLIPEPQDGDAKIEDFRRAEAEVLATRLREMVESGLTVGERAGTDEIQRPVRYGDMAVLFRAMSDAHIYEQSLRRHGVPFTIVSGAGFYERQEIRDLRNFLSLVADPFDVEVDADDEPLTADTEFGPTAGPAPRPVLRAPASAGRGYPASECRSWA